MGQPVSQQAVYAVRVQRLLHNSWLLLCIEILQRDSWVYCWFCCIQVPGLSRYLRASWQRNARASYIAHRLRPAADRLPLPQEKPRCVCRTQRNKPAYLLGHHKYIVRLAHVNDNTRCQHTRRVLSSTMPIHTTNSSSVCTRQIYSLVSNVDAALATLSEYLTKPPRRKDKAPGGFDTQLKTTCERSTTTRDVWVILLEAGFQAWYAYLVASSAARGAADALEPLQLREVANGICKVDLHEDMKEHFQHLFHGADRADFRRRKRVKPPAF